MDRSTLVFTAACLGSFVTGYSSGIISSTLGQPTWYSSMGLSLDPTSPDYAHTNAVTGGANGAFYGGGAVGCWLAAFLGERYGRIGGFKVAALVHLLGGILQCGAANQGMYLAARVISGIAVGQTSGAMTTYYAELSTAERRGWMAGLHGLMIEIGGDSAAFMGLFCYFATGRTPGTFAWRFPVSLIVLWSLMFFAVTWFLPESPRWLMRHDRADEALRVLESLHTKKSAQPGLAQREFLQIKAQSDADDEAIRIHGKWQIITQATYRKRLILAFLIVCNVQSVGILVVINYGVQLYTQLGLNTATSLALIAVWIFVQVVAVTIGNLYVDKIGRRVSLIAGFAGCAISMAIFTVGGALHQQTGETKYAYLCIVFLFIMALPFGLFLTNHQFTVATEIFPNHLRGVASSIAISGLYLIQTMWLNVAPLALTNIKWRYYLVFVVMGLAGCALVYFFLPETMNVPLEELDEVFGQKVATHLNQVTVADAEEGIKQHTQIENIDAEKRSFTNVQEAPGKE